MATPAGLCLLVGSSRYFGSRFTYVPVKIRSPGWRVTPWLRKETAFRTLKIMSEVFSSCHAISQRAFVWASSFELQLTCLISPLTLVQILRVWGSLIILLDTIPGP